MRAGKIVLIDDLATDERFGSYRPHALALGVRSSLSPPLDGGDSAVGALNLCSTRVHSFDPAEQAEARRFADEASRALTLAVRFAHHIEITDQLQNARTSRAAIDQTIGIILGQNRCDADTAFAILRTASQNRNVKLRVVAHEIIAAVSKGPPSPVRPIVTDSGSNVPGMFAREATPWTRCSLALPTDVSRVTGRSRGGVA